MYGEHLRMRLPRDMLLFRSKIGSHCVHVAMDGATVCGCSSVETNSVIYFAYGSVFGAFLSRGLYFNFFPKLVVNQENGVVFNCLSKAIGFCFGFALLRSVIG